MTLRLVTNTLLSLLLSPPCAICGEVLAHPLDGAVCEVCWASLDQRPTSFSLPSLTLARALGHYEGTLRDIIHALKYDGRRSVAPRLSALMAHHSKDVLLGADLAVPVPLHRRRRRQRGFNQADDLARALGLPVEHALKRVRATQPQVELPAEQRRSNVAQAFRLRRPVRGLVVVLVDDVATTGATLDACGQVLLRAGYAKEVRAVTAARVATAPRQGRHA